MPVPTGIREAAPAASTVPAQSFAAQASASTFGSDAARLKATPNAPFFLVHYAINWEVDDVGLDGPTWLPQLQRDWVSPGINCKVTRKAGQPVSETYRNSHSRLAARGATILPQDLQLDGFEFSGYLTQIDVSHPRTNAPGIMYHDKWERPLPARELGQRIKFARDRAGYNRWRLALVEQGIIAPPDVDRLGRAVDRAFDHIDRHAAKDVPDDRRKRMVEIATARHEYIEGARVPTRTAVIIESAPPPARPSVSDLKEQIAGISSIEMLRVIMHGETRPTAISAIEARIEAVEKAESFASQAST